MRGSYLFLAALFLFLLGCPQPRQTSGGDDDDNEDDDDSVADDDDVQPDDDDVQPDDDDVQPDDDDVQPDDDDADPGDAMVDVTYCLDWDTANITEPPGIAGLLGMAGITLSDYPILLSPTSVDAAAEQIELLGAGAVATTCTQDTSASTYDLTADGPGSWVAPHFEVGPTSLAIALDPSIGDLALEGAVLQGDFTGDASAIVNSTMDGYINVTTLDGACFILTCVTCPSGTGDCAVFAFDSATWNDNGLGPLVEVP